MKLSRNILEVFKTRLVVLKGHQVMWLLEFVFISVILIYIQIIMFLLINISAIMES